MRRRCRSELLPPDRGLQARMLFAMVVTPLVALAAFIGAIVLIPQARFTLVVVAGMGVAAAWRDDERRVCPPVLHPESLPHVHAIVERLCVLADLPKPDIVVEPERQPNSWVVARPHAQPRLHVTTGLLAVLPPDELEAVIAHELSHLAHHDARLMTVVGGLGNVLSDGARDAEWRWFLWAGQWVAAAIGWFSRLGAMSFARHRELVADTGAVALTGRPMALASALRRISGELVRVPAVDLRDAAHRDMLHLVAVEADARRSPLMRTHPPLARRVDRLERMEQRLHAARPAPPA
jgi:heat shock protein HtpX